MSSCFYTQPFLLGSPLGLWCESQAALVSQARPCLGVQPRGAWGAAGASPSSSRPVMCGNGAVTGSSGLRRRGWGSLGLGGTGAGEACRLRGSPTLSRGGGALPSRGAPAPKGWDGPPTQGWPGTSPEDSGQAGQVAASLLEPPVTGEIQIRSSLPWGCPWTCLRKWFAAVTLQPSQSRLRGGQRRTASPAGSLPQSPAGRPHALVPG